MVYREKYSARKLKPAIDYSKIKEGDVYSPFYNPFAPNKRISRRQKKWVIKIGKVMTNKIRLWTIFKMTSETDKQSYWDIVNKFNRLSSKHKTPSE